MIRGDAISASLGLASRVFLLRSESIELIFDQKSLFVDTVWPHFSYVFQYYSKDPSSFYASLFSPHGGEGAYSRAVCVSLCALLPLCRPGLAPELADMFDFSVDD